MPLDRKQLDVALTDLTEAWLDDGVDLEVLIEAVEAKLDELNEVLLREIETRVFQYRKPSVDVTPKLRMRDDEDDGSD